MPTDAAVYAQVSPRPFDLNVSFDETPAFVAIQAWSQFIQQSPDEKRRLLGDAEWRAAARAELGLRSAPGSRSFPVSRLDRVRLTTVPAGEERFLGGTFADARRGARRAPLRRARGLGARARPRARHDGRGASRTTTRRRVSELIADPTTVVGASDAGAHLQMMCGAGDSTLLLTEHVRDRGDLTIEAGRAPAHRAHRHRVRSRPPRCDRRGQRRRPRRASRSTSSRTNPSRSCTTSREARPASRAPPVGFAPRSCREWSPRRTGSRPARGPAGR